MPCNQHHWEVKSSNRRNNGNRAGELVVQCMDCGSIGFMDRDTAFEYQWPSEE